MAFHQYFSLDVQKAPPIVYKGAHTLVLVIVIDPETGEQKFVVGKKNHFPPDVYRMIGGGLDDDEEAYRDAETELREEVELSPSSYELVPLARVTINVTELSPPDDDDDDYEYPDRREHSFVTDLFLHHAGDQELYARDDMDELVTLTEDEFRNMIDTLRNQDNDHDEDIDASWRDWGNLYAIIHEIALNEAKNVQLAAA